MPKLGFVIDEVSTKARYTKMEVYDFLRNALTNSEATAEGKLLSTTILLTAANKLLMNQNKWSQADLKDEISKVVGPLAFEDIKVIERRNTKE